MELKDISISFAQNREDIIISAFFADVKKGFYVDVGANHPLYHSVTKLFYDKGWKGINIEPNPKLFEQINKHRSTDINLMTGISDRNGNLTLRVYHSRDGLEGISTMSEEMQKDYLSNENLDNKDYTDIEVKVTTLKEIFTLHKTKHIHFMKVDVEGYEYEVLKGNDWGKFRPELLCIESSHIVKDWRPILKQANYNFVFNDGLNDYYLSKESISRKKNFDYSQTFLIGKPVVGFELSEKLRTLENEVTKFEEESKQLKEQLALKQKELTDKNHLLNEITPLKKHIKRQVLIRLTSKNK